MSELSTHTRFRCDYENCTKEAEGGISWPPREWVSIFSGGGTKQADFCCWQHAAFYVNEKNAEATQLVVAE